MNSGKAEKRKRERETEEKEGRVEEVLEKNGIAVKFRLQKYKYSYIEIRLKRNLCRGHACSISR